MVKEKSPAFMFYPKDWLTDARVQLMSPAARGLYIDALAVCWIEGALPRDHDALAKVLRVTPVEIRHLWKQVRPCFELNSEKKWFNKRLNRERAKQLARRAQMSDVAKRRWKTADHDA